MSALTKTLHPDEKIKAGKLGGSHHEGRRRHRRRLPRDLARSSATRTAATADHHWKRFLYAYVVGWAFIFSIALGALWLVLLHHLVRGRWATVVRRIAEAISGAFPIDLHRRPRVRHPAARRLQGPLLLGEPDGHDAALNPTLAHKLGWLSPASSPSATSSTASSSSGIARYFAQKSRQQDESGDPKITEQLRIVSGARR